MMRQLALALAAAVFALLSPGSALANESGVLRVLFGGDTAHAGSYHEQYARDGRENYLASRGHDYSLRGLAPILARADYAILNLETVHTRRRVSPFPSKDYLHWEDPDLATERLAAYGVDAVSLANNHTLDFGDAGLNDTFAALRQHGISWFGAGPNAEEAARPLVRAFRLRGGREVRLAVIGSFEPRESYLPYNWYATADRGGANRLDIEHIRAQVQDLRARYPGIFIVAFPHWGDNYVWRTEQLATWGRSMIDVGVDMVVGHGAHTMQEIERYRDRWIIYGLGNFMFNTRGRFAAYPDVTPIGLALELTIAERGDTLETTARLYPILSDNRFTDYQARPPDPTLGRAALATLITRSNLPDDASSLFEIGADEIGAHLALFGIEGRPAPAQSSATTDQPRGN